MAKYFKQIFGIIISIILFTSCDNSEPIGDLLGQWKLEKMTYNNATTSPEDLYLRFQSQYVEAYRVNGSQVFGIYVNGGTTMTMKFYYSDREDYEKYPTDPHNSAQDLANFNFYNDTTVERTAEDIEKGIYPVNLRFKIETLDADNLILSDANGNRWVFTKW